uniref:Uncharacterized protein n=1 Tax=Chromera velia CCMP2878 TaxID=1169474 RepID=A0A0G4FKS4_9ALVE|eukprot:Cvel_17384.t1-p1 / transcript=Cvel_17384.t1 / gene=Cvel_17384 / organism=Chromera_velia_CCMP2878 / gene_product=hypothetical protein / transcript_product=hypothetical protein / location=Cvel_scaffold1383:13152-22549(+) / protein_length=1288 / sequence_SO=supercontig / SO=protein_coding / is_pseudo=false
MQSFYPEEDEDLFQGDYPPDYFQEGQAEAGVEGDVEEAFGEGDQESLPDDFSATLRKQREETKYFIDRTSRQNFWAEPMNRNTGQCGWERKSMWEKGLISRVRAQMERAHRKAATPAHTTLVSSPSATPTASGTNSRLPTAPGRHKQKGPGTPSATVHHLTQMPTTAGETMTVSLGTRTSSRIGSRPGTRSSAHPGLLSRPRTSLQTRGGMETAYRSPIVPPPLCYTSSDPVRKNADAEEGENERSPPPHTSDPAKRNPGDFQVPPCEWGWAPSPSGGCPLTESSSPIDFWLTAPGEGEGDDVNHVREGGGVQERERCHTASEQARRREGEETQNGQQQQTQQQQQRQGGILWFSADECNEIEENEVGGLLQTILDASILSQPLAPLCLNQGENGEREAELSDLCSVNRRKDERRGIQADLHFPATALTDPDAAAFLTRKGGGKRHKQLFDELGRRTKTRGRGLASGHGGGDGTSSVPLSVREVDIGGGEGGFGESVSCPDLSAVFSPPPSPMQSRHGELSSLLPVSARSMPECKIAQITSGAQQTFNYPRRKELIFGDVHSVSSPAFRGRLRAEPLAREERDASGRTVRIVPGASRRFEEALSLSPTVARAKPAIVRIDVEARKRMDSRMGVESCRPIWDGLARRDTLELEAQDDNESTDKWLELRAAEKELHSFHPLFRIPVDTQVNPGWKKMLADREGGVEGSQAGSVLSFDKTAGTVSEVLQAELEALEADPPPLYDWDDIKRIKLSKDAKKRHTNSADTHEETISNSQQEKTWAGGGIGPRRLSFKTRLRLRKADHYSPQQRYELKYQRDLTDRTREMQRRHPELYPDEKFDEEAGPSEFALFNRIVEPEKVGRRVRKHRGPFDGLEGVEREVAITRQKVLRKVPGVAAAEKEREREAAEREMLQAARGRLSTCGSTMEYGRMSGGSRLIRGSVVSRVNNAEGDGAEGGGGGGNTAGPESSSGFMPPRLMSQGSLPDLPDILSPLSPSSVVQPQKSGEGGRRGELSATHARCGGDRPFSSDIERHAKEDARGREGRPGTVNAPFNLNRPLRPDAPLTNGRFEPQTADLPSLSLSLSMSHMQSLSTSSPSLPPPPHLHDPSSRNGQSRSHAQKPAFPMALHPDDQNDGRTIRASPSLLRPRTVLSKIQSDLHIAPSPSQPLPMSQTIGVVEETDKADGNMQTGSVLQEAADMNSRSVSLRRCQTHEGSLAFQGHTREGGPGMPLPRYDSLHGSSGASEVPLDWLLVEAAARQKPGGEPRRHTGQRTCKRDSGASRYTAMNTDLW